MRVGIDEGDGPAVVLLHGQPGTADLWRAAVPALLRLGMRVIAVDRPGYEGRPERATGFAGNARALVALLDSLDLDTAYLIGHSWAGGVALSAAAVYPDRVDGLVLLASVGSPLSVGTADRLLARPSIGRLATAAIDLAGHHAARPLAWSSGSRAGEASVSQISAVLDNWRAIGAWRAFQVEQRALVTELPAVTSLLARVRCPVSVVQGRRDGYVSLRAGRDLARRLPGSRLVETDGGHALPVEQPDLPAAVLAELIRRSGADRG